MEPSYNSDYVIFGVKLARLGATFICKYVIVQVSISTINHFMYNFWKVKHSFGEESAMSKDLSLQVALVG